MAFEQIAALIVFAALGWVGFFLMWWRHRKAMELLTRSNAQFNAVAAEASRALDLACSWRNIAERRKEADVRQPHALPLFNPRCQISLDGPSALHSAMHESGDLAEHIRTRHPEAKPGTAVPFG